MFKVIKCGELFSINGVDAPYFPMLVNIELEPDEASLYEVNSYLRSFATKRKGVEKAKRIAAALCRFFNYHYYIRVRRVAEEIVAYTIIDESIIKRYQEWLKLKSDLGEASSRNTEIKYIYHFYWHLEHKVGAISGVIGIPDGVRGLTYGLPVRKATARQKTDFLVPILEKEISKPAKPDTKYTDWEAAYIRASSKKCPLSARDALMIRVIIDTALRREELATLTTNLFDDPPPIDSKYAFVKLNRSKFDESKGQRQAPFPVELYRKIKQYKKTHRRKLKKEGVNDGKALFLSNRGSPLGLTSVNYVLNKYGLRPHDGRKLSLTELFIERIELGMSRDLAIAEVAEIAGHSAKSRGTTLEEYYLEASRILEARQLKAKSIREEDTKEMQIQKLEAKIEELQKKLRESTA